jgi:RNA polymerase sigma-70 factor (ECF subfamily)
MCRGVCEDESAELAEHYNKTEDKGAFAKIYELNWRCVRAYARRAAMLMRAPPHEVSTDYGKKEKKKKPITQDESRLSEICSSVWLAALQGIRGFKGKVCFRSWILGITRNKAVDDVREFTKRAGDVKVDALKVELGDARAVSAKQHKLLLEDVEAACESLTEDEMRVVFMRFWEELTFVEMAKELGITEGAVRHRIKLAFAKLRPELLRWASLGLPAKDKGEQ